MNPASGSVQDFTSPVQYTVTSPSVGTRVYTVTAISEDSISQEDKDKVELIKARIGLLPDTVTKSDSRMINLIEDEWNSLSEITKTLLPEESASRLSDAVTQLHETPFRITCVGSTTTEGGSTDSSKYSYPAPAANPARGPLYGHQRRSRRHHRCRRRGKSFSDETEQKLFIQISMRSGSRRENRRENIREGNDNRRNRIFNVMQFCVRIPQRDPEKYRSVWIIQSKYDGAYSLR